MKAGRERKEGKSHICSEGENGVENFTSCRTSSIGLNNKNYNFSNEAKMFELSLEKDFLSIKSCKQDCKEAS